MPCTRGRGKAKYYRTIKPKSGRYIHVAIVGKRGKRGGHTVGGPVKHTKRTRKI